MKLSDNAIEIIGELSTRDVIYRLLNHPKVTTAHKKRGYVDIRLPFDIYAILITILVEGYLRVEDLKHLGFDLETHK